MRPTRSLLIYIVAVFLGGALLAPWLYWAVQSVAPESSLAQSPFHRYMDRSMLIIAVAGIWPLVRNLGMKSWRDVGIVKPRGQWKNLGAGLLLGFGSLACVAVIVVAAHARRFNTDIVAGTIAGKLAGAVGTAIGVAIVEEILFRGAILGSLRKVWNWQAALLVSSMIYAIVHFLLPAEITGPVTWHSGLELLPQKLRGFGDLNVLIPQFFNLTLAGILLGLAYQRSGNLYFSIGLHAGWIFWLKSYGLLTVAGATASNLSLWGTQKLIDGWLALEVLACALVVLLLWPPEKSANSK